MSESRFIVTAPLCEPAWLDTLEAARSFAAAHRPATILDRQTGEREHVPAGGPAFAVSGPGAAAWLAREAVLEAERAGELEAERAPALVPMDAQLTIDGGERDIAPAAERLRLFEPAPAQIPGQTALELEADR